eukprot:superscaffoldBa00002229_g13601
MSKLSLGDKAASSKVSRWVDPSFTDLPGERFSLSGRMKGSQVLCSKAEPKRPRKRKGETGSSDPHASHLLKESAQRDQDEPWVHRYLPYSKAELAVHKKKVEEVENWMRLHTNTLKGGILLLTGPSGCGKTATVQVLCRELGLRVQEWTNPTSLEPYTSSQHVWRMNGLSCTSQLAQFQEFLLRANKYNCLKMVGDGGVTDIKLILVELLMVGRRMDLTALFDYKLGPVPVSIKDEYGCFRKGNNSVIVQRLGILAPNPHPPDIVLIDASQPIYHMMWPLSSTVADLAASIGCRLNRYIIQTFVIFDWYEQISAKDHEKQRRAGESSTEYHLSLTTPLPSCDKVMMNKTNKQRLVELACTHSIGDHIKMVSRADSIVTHDEADVSLISYMLDAARHGATTDFPNQFYRQPGSLHDVLRRFVKTSRCPLVFIVSDSLSGDSSSRFLFPRDILEELDISSISFNPVAPTTMMKVLTRISTLEAGKSCGRICVPDQAVLEMLCSGSSGDIRSAINSLQFSSLPDTPLEKGLCRVMKDRPVASLGKAVYRTNQTKNKSTQAKEREEGQAIGGKDASLFLFRALGKILHCKHLFITHGHKHNTK